MEVVGKAARDPPEQIGVIGEKDGTVLALLTVIVNVVDDAHCVPPGVNV